MDGNYSGWTTSTVPANGAWVINNCAYKPYGPGNPIAPISGSYDAMTDQANAAIHSLYQTIVLPTAVESANLSWSDRIRSNAPLGASQSWAAKITDGSGSLIQTIFSTNAGDAPSQLGPNSRSFDLTALVKSRAGQTVRLVFENRVNDSYFNVNLDIVSFTITAVAVAVAVPEPATLALAASALPVALGAWLRRRSKVRLAA